MAMMEACISAGGMTSLVEARRLCMAKMGSDMRIGTVERCECNEHGTGQQQELEQRLRTSVIEGPGS